jgi:ketosteroid isomerase-like protein
MGIAADEILARHAVVVRVFHRVNLPDPVRHRPIWSLYQIEGTNQSTTAWWETIMFMSIEVFDQFVAAINGHDLGAIATLLAPDHVFVDSLGNRVQGAVPMQAGWRSYLAMCPDYWIRTDSALAEGAMVLAAGAAGGTIDGHAWSTPAAWQASIRAGQVAEWRVFADNQPVYEILAKRQTK